MADRKRPNSEEASSSGPPDKRIRASLIDPEYALTQEDLSNIARTHYNWISGGQAQGQSFFEVIGSVTQLDIVLRRQIPHLEAGTFSTLTLILNLGTTHWTTLVVAPAPVGDGPPRLAAYYADSFGARPTRYGERRSDHRSVDPASISYDDVVMSYSNVMATLGSATSRRHGPGIDFFDVSANQQTDFSSCGVFALENARIINREVMNGGNVDEIRTTVRNENINIQVLRETYADELARELQGERGETNKEGVAVGEPDNGGTSNEDDEDSGAVEDGDEEEADEEENDAANEVVAQAADPTENFDAAVAAYQRNRSFANFANIMGIVLTNPRDYQSGTAHTVWELAKHLDELPRQDDTPRMRESLYALLDFIEESEDSQAYVDNNFPHPDFIQDVLTISENLVGSRDIISYKLWLQLIIHSTSPHATAAEALDEPRALEDFERLFAGGVPRPDTGTFLDGISDDDIIRDVRYLYALGIVYRRARKREQAREALREALAWAVEAQDDDDFMFRRGEFAPVDLDYSMTRIYRELADVSQELGQDNEALSFLTTSNALELANRRRNEYPPGYVTYLKFLHRYPNFTSSQLRLFVASGAMIPMRYQRGFSTLLRARADVLFEAGQTKEADTLLRLGIAYMQDSLTGMIHQGIAESAFADEAQHGFYQLIYNRHLLAIRTARGDLRLTLEAHMMLVKAIRLHMLEDEVGPEYEQSLRAIVDQLQVICDSEYDPELQELFTEVARYFEDAFSTDQLDAEEPYRTVVGDFYRVLANNAFRLGDLSTFLMNMFASQNYLLRTGRRRIDVTEDERVLTIKDALLLSLQNTLANIEDDRESEAVAAVVTRLRDEFLGIQALVHATLPGATDTIAEETADRNPVPRLAALAQQRLTTRYYNYRYGQLQSLIRSTVVQRALARVRQQLDDVFNFRGSSLEERVSQEQPGPSCPKRRRRYIDYCVDSNTEEKNSDGSEETILGMGDEAGEGEERPYRSVLDYYNALENASEELTRAETLSYESERLLKQTADNLPREVLNGMDINLRIIAENLRSGGDMTSIDAALKSGHVAMKIRTASESAGLLFTFFLVGKHVANGNFEDLGFDTLNLYVVPKIGEKMTSCILRFGEKLESTALKAAAPILGRALGNFAAFLGLYESIESRAEAVDPIDKAMADVNIATNSIFIATDIPGIAAETAATFGAEVGLAGEFAGPVGMAVSVSALIAAQFVEAGLQIRKVEKLFELTRIEDEALYWRFFLGMSIPENVQKDIEFKDAIRRYISGILSQFPQDFHRVVISLPVFLTSYVRVRLGGKNPLFQEVCVDRTIEIGTAIRPRDAIYMLDIDWDEGRQSRLFPHELGQLKFVCGPRGSDVREVLFNRTVNETNPPKKCYYATTEVLLEKFTKTWDVGSFSPQCDGALVFQSSQYKQEGARSLLYLDSQTAVLMESPKNMTLLFKGKSFVVGRTAKGGAIGEMKNRFHFSEPLRDCGILTEGTNFIYINGGTFNCSFDKEHWKQNNVVFTSSDEFRDCIGLDGIVGSNETNVIHANYVEHVDGKGGADKVYLGGDHLVTIKSYNADTIIGKNGVVLLPFNFGDLSEIRNLNGLTIFTGNFRNETLVHGNVSLSHGLKARSADGLFVSPIRMTNDGLVTHLQAVCHRVEDSELLEFVFELKSFGRPPSFSIIIQGITPASHVTIADAGSQIFQADGRHSKFYWEGDRKKDNMYLVPEKGEVLIRNARGILNLEALSKEARVFLRVESEGGLSLVGDSLNVFLFAGWNITLDLGENRRYSVTRQEHGETTGLRAYFPVSLDVETFVGFDGISLRRNYCAYALSVRGWRSMDVQDLKGRITCISFIGASPVIFVKSANHLLLVTSNTLLRLTGYYNQQMSQENWLALKHGDVQLSPETFRSHANTPHSFRLYPSPSGNSVTIFHNQPHNKNKIGIIDMNHLFVKDVSVSLETEDLVMTARDYTRVVVSNWATNNLTRQMIFIFSDATITECVLGCESERLVTIVNSLQYNQTDFDLGVEDEKEERVNRKRRAADVVTQSIPCTRVGSLWNVIQCGIHYVSEWFHPVTEERRENDGDDQWEPNARALSAVTPNFNETLVFTTYLWAMINKGKRKILMRTRRTENMVDHLHYQVQRAFERWDESFEGKNNTD